MPTNTRNKVIIAIVMLFIILSGAWLSFLYFPLITDEQGYKYTVRSGTSMHAVIEDLANANVISHPNLFKLLVRIKGNAHELKSGQYLFPEGTSSSSLLYQITTGKGVLNHVFTIIPGWSFKDIRTALQQDTYLTHDTQNLSNDEIMHRVALTNVNPEGELYPDTYYFTEGSSDIALLKRAYHAMQEKMNTAWEHRDPDLPYQTSYEALIAASLIEKEAKLSSDRPLIAGVIVNRLKKNMLLQIDPTVIYGMGSRYNGVIHKTDLQEDTPYNTYIHKGLPPTPIAMPGQESIEAALHPKKHDYYYFVVKGQGESAHQFSETLDEHNSAVLTAKKSYDAFFNSDLIQHYYSKHISEEDDKT